MQKRAPGMSLKRATELRCIISSLSPYNSAEGNILLAGQSLPRYAGTAYFQFWNTDILSGDKEVQDG